MEFSPSIIWVLKRMRLSREYGLGRYILIYLKKTVRYVCTKTGPCTKYLKDMVRISFVQSEEVGQISSDSSSFPQICQAKVVVAQFPGAQVR